MVTYTTFVMRPWARVSESERGREKERVGENKYIERGREGEGERRR